MKKYFSGVKISAAFFLAVFAFTLIVEEGKGQDDNSNSSPFKSSGQRLKVKPGHSSATNNSLPQKTPPQNELLEKAMHDSQQQFLESLKRSDPKRYDEAVKAENLNKQIEEVIERYRKKKIDDSQARAELKPLIKQQLKPEIEGMDARIKQLEKELDFLRKVKKDPDALLERRIKQKLSQASGRFELGDTPF